MKISEVSELSVQERFFYWVKERDSIRAKRALGLTRPWTDDEILQQYKFTNVRRMDDRVSQWLYLKWYKPYKNHPNMLAACALARHFNLPAALVGITSMVFRGDEVDLEGIKKHMRARKAAGDNIFNGAYMVRGIGTSDKTEMVVDRVVKPLIDKPPAIDYKSMEKSVEALLPYWGFSLFMAGQVIADLRWATNGSWADRKSWAPMGPGSKRGLNRLEGRDKNKPMSQEEFMTGLRTLMMLAHSMGVSVEVQRRMEAIDWQNCLCEFDKYERCLHGEGRPKCKYPGV